MRERKPLDTWYLKDRLEEAEECIKVEEDFADGGLSPDEIYSMIVEILAWRSGKTVKCKDHPEYQGIHKPRSTKKNPNGCQECYKVWEEKQ